MNYDYVWVVSCVNLYGFSKQRKLRNITNVAWRNYASGMHWFSLFLSPTIRITCALAGALRREGVWCMRYVMVNLQVLLFILKQWYHFRINTLCGYTKYFRTEKAEGRLPSTGKKYPPSGLRASFHRFLQPV